MTIITTAAPVHALEPARVMSQYLHHRWEVDSGFPGGAVSSIAQTPDGYLWIGTEKGLVRFDGLTFRFVQPSNVSTPQVTRVLGLAVDAEGALWVRLQGADVLRYRDGVFEEVMPKLDRGEAGVTAMSRAQNGDIILSALINGVLRYDRGRSRVDHDQPFLSPSLVISMSDTPDGTIWLGTRDAGLFTLRNGQFSHVTGALPDAKINCLLPLSAQEVWLGTDNGVVRWSRENTMSASAAKLPAELARVQPLAMLKDRESNIWIGTASSGLLRVNAGGVSSLKDDDDGRAPRSITSLFEDREGNLWIGTSRGLERLRDGAFLTYPSADARHADVTSFGAIYVDTHDRTWFAPATGGLHWLRGKDTGSVPAASLDGDVIYSIDGDHDDVWVGRQRGGLTHLRIAPGDGSSASVVAATTFTQADGLAQNSVYAVHRSRDGAIWAGTLSGGVSLLKDGKITTFTMRDGLTANTISGIAEGVDGKMWFATPSGVSVWSGRGWRRYAESDGLPSATANCLFADSSGRVWIGTAQGLAMVDATGVRVVPDMPDALHESIAGLTADRLGFLWIATASSVLRVNSEALLRGAVRDTDLREYGLADGLQSVEAAKRFQSVLADSRGRIWFSMTRGLSVVDPARVLGAVGGGGAGAGAIAHIEWISADGVPLDPRQPIRLSSARQRITFGYTGLSLSVPERVKFQYRLDGFDREWSPPGTSREAVYTNLNPGTYHFRVLASNSDGVWNGAEAGVGFLIEPQFWQTMWFRLAIAALLAFVVWLAFRVRMLQLSRQLNVRFEERLAERTRIAQELHDTLLQGFISASMQLHVTSSQLPADSPAKQSLSRVQHLMRQVIDEGRNAVRGLRIADASANDLDQAFARIQQELTSDHPIAFRVIVEGRQRALHPVIRDEVYRIGREALVNAFRHAGAKSIEVELDYSATHVRLLVRDDGAGIDPAVLRSGRDGHWGLSGMRERAERIGARLRLRSRAAAGTEVELSVPSHVAFPAAAAVGPSKWLRTRLTAWFARRPRLQRDGTAAPSEIEHDP